MVPSDVPSMMSHFRLLVNVSKNLIAAAWGVKLPADFSKQAETYQAELDAALKELA